MTLYTNLYQAGNYRGLACMLANALHSAEVDTPRLEKPPRGPFVREANYARSVYVHQRSLKSDLSQRRFATKMLGVSMTAWNNWIDGVSRLRSDSIEKLAKYAPANLPRPLGVAADESLASDNQPPYDPVGSKQARGYAVQTNEGAIIARWMDRISDDQERGKALARCIQELSANPRGVATEKRPDRPTTGKG